MKKVYLFLSLFIFCATMCCISCSQQKISNHLRSVEQIINDKPDSALVLLGCIDCGQLHRKERAQFDLLYAMALDKNYIDTTDVSIIEPAIAYFRNHRDNNRLVASLYYQGRIQQNAGNYSSAAVSFAEAEGLISHCKDKMLKARLYMEISNNYGYTFNNPEALNYSRKALDVVKQEQISSYLPRMTYHYACALASDKQLDSAICIFDSLYVSSFNDEDLKYLCLKRGTLYKTLLHSAPPFDLKKDFEAALSKDTPFDSDGYCAYAYVLGRCGEADKADEIFLQLRESGIEGQQASMTWESDLAAINGNYKKAYQLLDGTLSYQDSIVRHTLQQSLSRTQKDYFQTKLTETEREQQIERLTFVVTTMTVLLFLIVFTFLFYSAFKRQLEKERESKSKIEALTDSLKSLEKEATTTLSSFRKRYLSKMFRPLGQLYSDYQFHLQHGDDIKLCRKQLLETLEDINIEKDDGWFENILNVETEGLPTRFKASFPNIKKEEYRLFCFYLAGFDATTISIIGKIPSQNAVYARKSRLRKMITDAEIP